MTAGFLYKGEPEACKPVLAVLSPGDPLLRKALGRGISHREKRPEAMGDGIHRQQDAKPLDHRGSR